MAIYSTSFDEYASGSQPSDWTQYYNTANSFYTVTDDGVGGKFLRHSFDISTGTRFERVLSWNTVDADANRNNIEVLIRARTSNTTGYQQSIYVRASGANSSVRTSYQVQLNNQTLDISRYLSGSAWLDLQNVPFTYAANQYIWIRFRVNGSTIQARAWADGTNEPASWMVSATNTDISAAGWNGLGGYDWGGARDYDYVSYATNGDTAIFPTSTRTIIGKSRIGLVTNQDQTGISSIYIAPPPNPDAQSLYELANWGFAVPGMTFWGDSPFLYATITPQDQIGKARITNVTSQNITGISRLAQTVAKTQLGIARVTASASRLQLGVSRITNTTSQAQTGISRVQTIVPKDQLGKARIGVNVQKIQTGTTRITVSTTRDQIGKANLFLQQQKAQTGISNIDSPVKQRDQLGKANLVAQSNQPQLGQSRMQIITSRSQTGITRVTAITQQLQLGKTSIARTSSQDQVGLSRLQYILARDQTGRSSIAVQVNRAQTGVARLISERDIRVTGQGDTYDDTPRGFIVQDAPQGRTGADDVPTIGVENSVPMMADSCNDTGKGF